MQCFGRKKRKYNHIYVYLLLCKMHNDYKCIEISNQHIKNFKVRFLEKCEMAVKNTIRLTAPYPDFNKYLARWKSWLIPFVWI